MTPSFEHWSRGSLHRDDLFWYFNESASELGERSNYGSLVALLEGGGGAATTEPDEIPMLPVERDIALRAAKRWRRIHHLLGRLDERTVQVLQAFHTQRNRGKLDVDYPDGFSGVVVLLLAGRAPKPLEREALRARAHDAVLTALAAYRQATEALLAA